MRAFVTGACGQDGHYLITELKDHGHEVHALYRGQDELRFLKFQQDYPEVIWHRGDVTDASSIAAAIQKCRPEMVFNLAALSFVGNSWAMPQLYMETNATGFLNVLEAVRLHSPEAHVIQASTSEMFGNAGRVNLNEDSPMVPASPYGVSKLAAHRLCEVYRKSYGMRVSSAISFNHESPRRPPIFVTRKITQAVAQGKPLSLGNTSAERDWGFAGDFMRAYLLMAEQSEADDYVIGTGEAHAVWEFLAEACAVMGYAGSNIKHDEAQKRPNDVEYLCADPSKIKAKLGWEPDFTFRDLVTIMVNHDRIKTAVAV